ncbi:hypothetical protein GCM10028808_43490 [Spirosoma migulaei]
MPDLVLIQNNTVSLVVKRVADMAAVDLLQNTLYGTKGIRYRQTGQERKIPELFNPLFFHLYINGSLQGLYCLDRRVVEGNSRVEAFYGRYLAVSKAYQRKGYGKLLKTEAVKYVRTLIPEPFLFYSYVEEKNIRSLILSQQLDFRSITTLKTFVFRHLYPVVDKRFCRLDDHSLALPLLKAYYKNYSLAVYDKVFENGNYFILKEGQTILAGVHASPTTWQFDHMPGLMGWIMMNGFPKLPILKKLFKPTYTFLSLEGIYLSQGSESLLAVLIESVLAHFKLHAALVQIDTRDKLIHTVQVNKGRLSGFQKGVSTHVLVKPISLTDSQFKCIQDGVVYVSSFDFT